MPSARFRVRQYIPALHRAGIEVREYSAMMRSYPPRHKALRPFWGAAAVIERAISEQQSVRTALPSLSTAGTGDVRIIVEARRNTAMMVGESEEHRAVVNGENAASAYPYPLIALVSWHVLPETAI